MYTFFYLYINDRQLYIYFSSVNCAISCLELSVVLYGSENWYLTAREERYEAQFRWECLCLRKWKEGARRMETITGYN
jgi:hypothetical protein